MIAPRPARARGWSVPDPTTPTPTVAPLLVGEREAARLLGISARKLWSMAAGGEVPYVKIGTAKRYSIEALRTWIAAHEQGAR
ncbi:MAG: helix-turn-helix domain-containing protein [Planctomycetes bacterium]|nr:helix-turn-helix domain-containing protein [Planctomycetota bacterium]